ncbi:MAG TPA: hypothetical protein VGB24_01040 [Longimicrobium sp.]|jgi:hypothetical protein|uniref:hypothetical protein n=1 Tax=Longimicrobium sp. TaxID=2029185 RepID=UPI002ED78541
MLVCCAAMAAGACEEAQSVEVQPLPPLQRPSPEARAGLPEVRGLWRFAGFEIPASDTTLVRERVYALTPPGDFQIATQRLDSIAGQYLRAGVAFPIVGEVRRDSAVSLVLFSGGTGQFVAGHVRRDTLWVELTTFQSAVESWPRGTRAALVRRVSGPPFRRLLGGAPITVPVDSTRLDSLRMDSLRRAGVVVPPAGTQPAPGQPMPGAVPPAMQPGVPPAAQPQRPPVTQPQRPPATQPRPPAAQPRQPVQQRPPAQRPPAQRPPPAPTPRETIPEPRPETPPPAPLPRPNAPRDTIRFPAPPR